MTVLDPTLAARLTEVADWVPSFEHSKTIQEAVAALAALQAENARMREALETIRARMGGENGDEGFNSPEDVWGIARAALSPATTEGK